MRNDMIRTRHEALVMRDDGSTVEDWQAGRQKRDGGQEGLGLHSFGECPGSLRRRASKPHSLLFAAVLDFSFATRIDSCTSRISL
jgi:hypothetical protein